MTATIPEVKITPRYLTVKQAAEFMGRTPAAVYHLIERHQLKAIRKGRRVHLDRDEINRWQSQDHYF